MPFLSGSNNQFQFRFPKIFIPIEIEKKYKPILHRVAGFPIDECSEFLNYAIQSIQLNTSINQQVIEQTDTGTSYTRTYRSQEHQDKLYEKNFVIVFQLDSAYLLYFMLCDIFFYYYQSDNKKYVPEAFYITIIDQFNKQLYRINLHSVIFYSISGIEMNFSNRSIDMKQLTTNWHFDKMDIELIYEPNQVHNKIPVDFPTKVNN